MLYELETTLIKVSFHLLDRAEKKLVYTIYVRRLFHNAEY